MGSDYRYVTHRPPTVVDKNGINLRSKGHLDGPAKLKSGSIYITIVFVFLRRVRDKCLYYQEAALESNEGWCHGLAMDGCD